MRRSAPFTILLALSLFGCASPRHQEVPEPQLAPESPAIATAQSSRSIEAFRFIGPNTTIQDVIEKLGMPDRDVGSGIYIFVYKLRDGTEVIIRSSDGTHITFAGHGKEPLFRKE